MNNTTLVPSDATTAPANDGIAWNPPSEARVAAIHLGELYFRQSKLEKGIDSPEVQAFSCHR